MAIDGLYTSEASYHHAKRKRTKLPFSLFIMMTMAAFPRISAFSSRNSCFLEQFPSTSSAKPTLSIQGSSSRGRSSLHALKVSAPDVSSASAQSPVDSSLVADLTTSEEDKNEQLKGLLALAAVPVILGTYVPLVQFLYGLSPAVPGTLFQAAYFSVASTSSLSLLAYTESKTDTITRQQRPENEANTVNDNSNINRDTVLGGLEIGTYLFLAATLQVLGLETIPAARAGFLVQISTILVPLAEAATVSMLFSMGSEATSNKKAAIPSTTWVACLMTLTGIGIMGFDGQEAPMMESSLSTTMDPLESAVVLAAATDGGDSFIHAAASSSSMLDSLSLASFPSTHLLSFSTGDWLTMGAACMYTMSIVRLGAVTKKTSPLRITAAKSTVEMMWSVGLVVLSVFWSTRTSSDMSTTSSPTENVGNPLSLLEGFLLKSGDSILEFRDSFQEFWTSGSPTSEVAATGSMQPWDYVAQVSGVTVYTGVVATALLVLLQSYGQQRVTSPTQANLLYSLQPLCTAFFSFVLLGQTMGTMGYAGASFMLAALLLVATTSSSSDGDAASP